MLPAYSYAYTSQPLSLLYQCLQQQLLQLSENLTEEELTVFDILTRPGPDLSAKKRGEITKVANILLERLKTILTLDWRKRADARDRIQLAIEDILDEGLPRVYTPELYQGNVRRCSSMFTRTTLVRASVCTRRRREVRWPPDLGKA